MTVVSRYGAIAQLVEHLHGMQGVRGSNPLGSIEFHNRKDLNPLAAIFAENFARNGKNLTIEELDKLVKFLNNYTQEELKFAALIMASKLVAKKRGLSLEQQMLVWIPLSWREE